MTDLAFSFDPPMELTAGGAKRGFVCESVFCLFKDGRCYAGHRTERRVPVVPVIIGSSVVGKRRKCCVRVLCVLMFSLRHVNSPQHPMMRQAFSRTRQPVRQPVPHLYAFDPCKLTYSAGNDRHASDSLRPYLVIDLRMLKTLVTCPSCTN